VRLLLASDGMGFSFHITTLYAGTETHMWYKHHLEAVYCISGRAEIEDKATGEEASDRARHHVRTRTSTTSTCCGCEEDFVCACVFNPPLKGTEVHDAEGAYGLDAAKWPQ
jgi:L-ectoine synthase